MEVPDIRILNNKLYLNHSYTDENLNYLSILILIIHVVFLPGTLNG